jgi:hypothetical protein
LTLGLSSVIARGPDVVWFLVVISLPVVFLVPIVVWLPVEQITLCSFWFPVVHGLSHRRYANQASLDPCHLEQVEWRSLLQHRPSSTPVRVISFLASQLKILIFMTARRTTLKMKLDCLAAAR